LTVASSTTSSVSLSWHAVTNSKLYNIYRDGQLVGTSTNNSFTDANLPFGRTYQYSVSAWDDHKGEGNMSSAVTATTHGTLTDSLDSWSLTSSHSAGFTLDTTNAANFNGDASRATRTTANDEYYSYEANGLTTVSFDLYYTNGANSTYANTAPNTTGPWTTLTLTQSAPVLTQNGWYKVTYQGTIASGQNVIGIHLIGGSAAGDQQIGSVTLTN
jgi:fibronectin type 3 domain-containing protein